MAGKRLSLVDPIYSEGEGESKEEEEVKSDSGERGTSNEVAIVEVGDSSMSKPLLDKEERNLPDSQESQDLASPPLEAVDDIALPVFEEANGVQSLMAENERREEVELCLPTFPPSDDLPSECVLAPKPELEPDENVRPCSSSSSPMHSSLPPNDQSSVFDFSSSSDLPCPTRKASLPDEAETKGSFLSTITSSLSHILDKFSPFTSSTANNETDSQQNVKSPDPPPLPHNPQHKYSSTLLKRPSASLNSFKTSEPKKVKPNDAPFHEAFSTLREFIVATHSPPPLDRVLYEMGPKLLSSKELNWFENLFSNDVEQRSAPDPVEHSQSKTRLDQCPPSPSSTIKLCPSSSSSSSVPSHPGPLASLAPSLNFRTSSSSERHSSSRLPSLEARSFAWELCAFLARLDGELYEQVYCAFPDSLKQCRDVVIRAASNAVRSNQSAFCDALISHTTFLFRLLIPDPQFTTLLGEALSTLFESGELPPAQLEQLCVKLFAEANVFNFIKQHCSNSSSVVDRICSYVTSACRSHQNVLLLVLFHSEWRVILTQPASAADIVFPFFSLLVENELRENKVFEANKAVQVSEFVALILSELPMMPSAKPSGSSPNPFLQLLIHTLQKKEIRETLKAHPNFNSLIIDDTLDMLEQIQGSKSYSTTNRLINFISKDWSLYVSYSSQYS